eukprot:TRINITY_DN35697_c0_g1_i1.p1 TRINITY_DN35697_c0_g1~~TRINITY_DN35697_c0_g1_i1.p1  ORF type:complete len:485 (+),score=57.21 TRINITY_DN35697_c0_g1_i1:63-1517(+)
MVMASMRRVLLSSMDAAINCNEGRVAVSVLILAISIDVLRRVFACLPAVFFLGALGLFAIFVGAICFQYLSLRAEVEVKRFMGTGEDMQRVYEKMPTAHRQPIPPFWAFGSHIQFVPWVLYNMIMPTLAPIPYDSEKVRVRGLMDKSKPESKENQHTVEDTVVVSYYPGFSKKDGECWLPLDAPLVFVEPGLTCTAQDLPGSSFPRLAVTRGYRVVVTERRGHAMPLESHRWNIFGDSADFEQVYNAVKKRFPAAPFFWMGYSSGCKLIIEGLGKFDDRVSQGDESAPRFVATAAISPGYNLETCFLGFGFPFNKMCLASVKGKFLLANESNLRAFNADAFEKAIQAPDLQVLTAEAAPFAGFPTATDYFKNQNPVLFAPLIRTPTLIVNAQDDPLTVVENAFKKMPGGKDDRTFAEMVSDSTCGLLLITRSGTHCPFLDGALSPFRHVARGLGGWICASWAEFCTLEFFEGHLTEHRRRSSDH